MREDFPRHKDSFISPKALLKNSTIIKVFCITYQSLTLFSSTKLLKKSFAYHSPEIALVNVLNDIHLNNDCGGTTELVLFKLSAAFNTVDNEILV